MNRDLYIKASSASDWQRPSDWLPMPTNITSSDQTFVGLHAVFPQGQNYVAFLFTTSAGQYQVDWGDGTVTLHNSNTLAQYEYNYNTISNSTLTSRGYKQAMITVTPVSGDLRTCNFQQRFVTTPAQNQAYATGFLDCILSMPNASTGQSITFGGTTVAHRYVERFDIKTIGSTNSIGSMFSGCSSLQSVPLFNTQNVTSMAIMFQNCSSLQSLPLFNTQNVTNMTSMFSGCSSLQSLPLFNTQNVTSMNSMFNGCQSLNFIPNFIITLVTDFINFAQNCSSLDRCTTIFRTSVGINNCQLSRTALVEIFTNLVDRTSTTSATINITGNWGATALTTAERNIAINKNWVITG